MKKFISMILFFITGIALQTHAMLDKSSNNKESTSAQPLLSVLSTSTPLIENDDITTRYQSNYINSLPITMAQNTGCIFSTIAPLSIGKKETHEQKDEIYEFIPLQDTQNNDLEENFSSKCQRCCIPLTKEKIAKLTKKNININLYRENKCGKRKLIAAIAIPGIIMVSGLIGLFTWVATIPDCHNSSSYLSPCWDLIW